MPADPVVSPADTPKNPGATIAEVLLLTEGYLDDGYGEADLRVLSDPRELPDDR